MKEEWSSKTIGELCSEGGGKVQTGPFGSQLHQSDYSDEGTPVVMPADIPTGQIDVTRIARVSESHVERLSRHQLNKGDIVYGRRGNIGRQALVRDDNVGWLCGTGCLRIRLGESEVDPDYLHRYLTMPEIIGWIEGQAIGATMPNLNTDILNRVPVYFPPWGEQRKIAAILTAYDDLIEANKRRITLLEKMAEELYREWFVRMRFPGHESTEFVKGIPATWDIREMESIVSDIIDYRGLTPTKLGGHWADEGIIALSALNVKSGELIRLGDSKRVSEQLYERWMRKELQAHDILLTSEAPLGQTYFLVEQHRYVLSQRLFAIRANPSEVSPAYLFQYLRYPIGQGQLESRATGATVGGIRQALLKKVEVIVPAADLMKRHEELVFPILQEIHMLWKQNTTLIKSRDLLLPRLISGKLAVEDLDIQFPPSMRENTALSEATYA